MYQLPIVAPGYGEEPPREEDLSRCLSNTCVIDKTVLTEALRGALNRPFFRILRIVEPLLIALCLGLLIWTLAARRGTGPAVLLGFVLVSVCLLYWLQFIRYPKKSVPGAGEPAVFHPGECGQPPGQAAGHPPHGLRQNQAGLRDSPAHRPHHPPQPPDPPGQGGLRQRRAGGAVPAPHQKMPQAQNGRKKRP